MPARTCSGAFHLEDEGALVKYRKPASIAYVLYMESADEAPTVFLYRIPDGPLLALEGTGSLLWMLAVEGEHDIVAGAAGLTSADATDIEADVLAFLDVLTRQGLIEQDT